MLRRSLVALALVGGLATTFGFTPLSEAQTAAKSPSDRQAPSPAQTDKALEDRIDYNLETNATVRKYNLDVKVEHGVATLTGDVATDLSKTGESINDAWILTKVKWFHTGADALKGSDINVDVKDGVVTLKGTVKSEAGRAKAIALAKDTDGVKRVVDQLTIK